MLHGKKKGSSLSYDLHYWLGEGTSVDESGAACHFAVELDDGLGKEKHVLVYYGL